MSIGNIASSQRVRPHIGIWIDNLRGRFQASSMDGVPKVLDRFQSKNQGSIAAMMTKAERKVAMTCTVWMLKDCCDLIIDYIKAHGMTKKATFNIKNLSSNALRVGCYPEACPED